jgi:hypothetical protein
MQTNMVIKMNKLENGRKPGKKRIMVQLWGTLAKAIERDFKAMHLKRDGYLNELLTREIEELAEEVTFKNSDEVRQRIRERPLPDRVKLNLELDDTLVLRIDEVLKEKNIPRDSFVNRVLFFLVAKQTHLEALNIEYESDYAATAKPLEDARGFLYNPFFHIRNQNNGCFYTLACFDDRPWGQSGLNLFALNTAISERDWIAMNIDSDALLEELGLFSLGATNNVSN